MNIEIVGPRVLVRAYSLPEQIGSIITPEHWRGGFDGKLFECEQVGRAFREALTPVGSIGPKIIPALRITRKRSTISDEPLLPIEPDDIISCKGTFRGIYAGPEIERHKGYPCWFLNATERVVRNGEEVDQPSIEWVWPAKSWRQVA